MLEIVNEKEFKEGGEGVYILQDLARDLSSDNLIFAWKGNNT